jgi:hypothetical protein
MFRVIGCGNVAPVGVEQLPASHEPLKQAQLLIVTVTLVRWRAVPARVIWLPNSLNAYASGPTLGKLAAGPFGMMLL